MPIMIAGMIIMAFMNSVSLAVVAMIVFGIGLGMGMPVFSLTVQNAVSPREIGVATSSVTFFRSMGGTLGTAIFLSVLFNVLPGKIAAATVPRRPARLRSISWQL